MAPLDDSDPVTIHAPHPSLSEYYDGEQGRTAFVSQVFDDAAEDYNRIERMMRESYGRGFIALEDLKDYTRAAMAEMVKGERVTGKRCTS